MRNSLIFTGSALGLLMLVSAAGCSAKHSSDFGDATDGGSSGSAVGDGGSGGSLSGGDAGDGGGISSGGGPGEVYGHSDDTLYKLEPISKTVTVIGKFSGIDINCNLGEGMWDIALDKDGNMYGSAQVYTGSDCSSSSGEILKIDKATAATTVLGTGSSFPNSLSFVPAGTIDPSNEVLVGYNGATYVRIDPTSGAVTTIGSLNPNSTGQDWFSSGDIVSVIGGKTYLTATLDPNSSSNDSILEVDPVTGKALSVIGTVGFGKVWGLGFWAGTAYGFDEGGQLFSIDLTSGASTAIPLGGSISLVSFYGAGNTTSAPVAPPR